MDNSSRRIRFKTKDNVVLESSVAAMTKSPTVRDYLINTGGEPDSGEIYLENISARAMRIIIKWCEEHIDYPCIENSDDPMGKPTPTEFDRELLKVGNDLLHELLCACVFLELYGLMDQGSRCVSSQMRGLDVKQMRRFLGIPSDSESEDENEPGPSNGRRR
ncbi:Protein CBG08898 [Caenorhabditis briggsae]|uniref:Skp1-related protein n=2 Tax=Caenorhabditis briggsae TaxID=6238 RepID=A0AAE9CXG4_CAEBR|nr:Protein CBG08898 [Caenorhabditis briggsae]ULT85256.1 hypothetical protein L3Y34_013795 [Caenorhabditis briggsae]UMM44476.1 hypothetical protein L5515_019621 [Caenorhabditis briggsae]CAP28640.1 Protein CBG08898 [Caenorhabditis briggsae]